MIEINLIPDVKYELLRARRMRATIISGSMILMVVAGGAVALLSGYVFGVQSVASWAADNSIKSEYDKLSSVKDLSKTLTIQSQLAELSSLHNDRPQTSRLLDMLTIIIPGEKNTVLIRNVKLDTAEGTVSMEAEASNGYEALEVFKKTIDQTKFTYKQEGGDAKSVSLASNITDGERSYGLNSKGERVLRFTLSFEYAPELFASDSKEGKIVAPTRQIATDSAVGVPTSLFTDQPKEDK